MKNTLTETSAAEYDILIQESVMIMCAPNGARRMHSDHPAVPLTASELASSAAEVLEAGASVLHLHVRDNSGKHSLDANAYKDAIQQIRARIGQELVIQITTEAVGIYNRQQQMAVVREVKPEAVSLALRELCPDDNSLAEAEEFFRWCVQRNIWAQYILYSADEVRRFNDLRERGVFGQRAPSALFVLGRYSQNLTGDPLELHDFINAWQGNASDWACCCFGKTEQQAMLLAAKHGGHVRLGFENNLWRADGSLANDNATLIRDFVSQVQRRGRPVASADDVRNRYLRS